MSREGCNLIVAGYPLREDRLRDTCQRGYRRCTYILIHGDDEEAILGSLHCTVVELKRGTERGVFHRLFLCRVCMLFINTKKLSMRDSAEEKTIRRVLDCLFVIGMVASNCYAFPARRVDCYRRFLESSPALLPGERYVKKRRKYGMWRMTVFPTRTPPRS